VEVFIDLGMADAIKPPAPDRRRPGLRPPGWLLLLLGVLLTLLTAASVVPARPPLAVVLTLPVAPNPWFTTADGVLYLFTDGALRAYTLSDNRPLWSQPIAEDVEGLAAQPRSGTLVVRLSPSASQGGVIVFDLATGAALWRRSAYYGQVVTDAGRMVLLGSVGPGTAVVRQSVTAFDLRTGATVWHSEFDGRVLAAAARAGADGAGTDLVVIESAQRTLRVVDADTGGTSAVAPLANLGPGFDTNMPASVNVVGTRLVVVGDGHAAAISLDTLTPQWQSKVPLDAFAVFDCGPIICLLGPTSTALVDPATGAVRDVRGWNWAEALPGGRVLAQAETSLMVLDDALAPVATLTGWSELATTDRAVLLSRLGEQTDDRWIGQLDPVSGRVLVLGRVRTGNLGPCVADGRYLVCRSTRYGIVAVDLGGDARRR
jgi:outer membrane protein assembly factor BamB